jgi:hypothetical protein
MNRHETRDEAKKICKKESSVAVAVAVAFGGKIRSRPEGREHLGRPGNVYHRMVGKDDKGQNRRGQGGPYYFGGVGREEFGKPSRFARPGVSGVVDDLSKLSRSLIFCDDVSRRKVN